MHPRDAQGYGRSKNLPRAFVVVDGRRLAYVRMGQGRPAIVLLAHDSGHFPQLQEPAVVVAAIREVGAR